MDEGYDFSGLVISSLCGVLGISFKQWPMSMRHSFQMSGFGIETAGYSVWPGDILLIDSMFQSGYRYNTRMGVSTEDRLLMQASGKSKLVEMGYVRELNEGVNRIYRSMEKSMLSEPKYSDRNDTVTLTLINKIAKHEKSIPDVILDRIQENWKNLNDTERRIVNHLLNNFITTVPKLMERMEISETAIRSNLTQLIELEIVERQSEKIRDKDAIYRFKKR